MKTSKSHSLRIDWVYIDDKTGKIGLTFCPGKKQKYAMTGSWNRDLETDIAAIKSSGYSALVTLMEEHELKYYGVPKPHMKSITKSHELDWFFLPIKDVDIPGPSFEQAWKIAVHQLISLLTNEHSIVVHCRGGLGRSGTIAGRLLVELGIDPDEAIDRVRLARPGAIETRAQEYYVREKGWLS
jgi:ADP-ribosyl-[dinitrogen reductase] hydrolase